MEFSLDDNRSGAGGSVLLSPEVVAIRTKLIELCDGKTFSETIEFLKQLLEKEQDEQKRLGILAARVLVLRQRISDIQEKQDASSSSKFIVDEMNLNDEIDSENMDDEAEHVEDETWVRLRITESSIVNGVRFPKGVIVDVHNEEADSLIEAGKAEIVEISEEQNQPVSKTGTDGTLEEEGVSKNDDKEEVDELELEPETNSLSEEQGQGEGEEKLSNE